MTQNSCAAIFKYGWSAGQHGGKKSDANAANDDGDAEYDERRRRYFTNYENDE